MAELILGATIQTARIPELPSVGAYGPLALTDKFAVWLSAFNKTVSVDVNTVKDLIETGGSGTSTPVVLGDKLLHVVTSGEAGGTIVSIPTIAGENFFLERDGQPLLTTEFSILNAGGFQLTASGDVLVEGQRFVLTLYSLQGGSSVSSSSSATLIKGAVTVSSNMNFDTVNHANKLIQIRENSGTHAQITYTLPLLSDIPDNTIIPIEAIINNTVEHKIATQSGQFIYLINTSKTWIGLRPTENIWLLKLADGFYVINDFADNYKSLAKPYASYEIGINEILCDGSTYSKTANPRAWEKIQTLGYALVDNATWNTASATTVSGQIVNNPYKGCFADVNPGTFRVPNLMNSSLRAVSSFSGTDNERVYNHPGGFQANQNASHGHSIQTTATAESSSATSDPVRGSLPGTVNTQGAAGAGKTIGLSGGNETRMDNVGIFWVIKF